MNPFLLTLLVYGAALIALGLFLSRTVRDVADFYVAGRNLGPVLLFATLLAANIGAGSTVGAAALGYLLGLSGWWWVGSAGIGTLILAFTVGPRMWRVASHHSLLTVGDYLEMRYGVGVRAIVAILLWFGTLAILAGQLIAFARILEVIAQTPKPLGCLLGGIVVVSYFAAGGLKAAAWINLLQLAVKGVGFLLSVPIALSFVGGWSSLQQNLIGRGLRTESFFSLTGIDTAEIAAYLVLLVPSFIVSPGLLQKIYGGRDARVVRQGVLATGVALLGFSFLPVVLGMVAAATYPQLAHAELALPTVITQLLPFWLGAVLLAAVFSAEVSSADAILFMLSTSLGKDLYQRLVNPGVSAPQLLRISRYISLLAGLLGVALAIMLESVLEALSIFYTLLSVALFVPLVAGLYWRRPGEKNCLAAVLVSVPAAVGFQVWTGGSIGFLSTAAFGILISAGVMFGALLGNRK